MTTKKKNAGFSFHPAIVPRRTKVTAHRRARKASHRSSPLMGARMSQAERLKEDRLLREIAKLGRRERNTMATKKKARKRRQPAALAKYWAKKRKKKNARRPKPVARKRRNARPPRIQSLLSRAMHQAAKRGDLKAFARHLRTEKLLEAERRPKKNAGKRRRNEYLKKAVIYGGGAPHLTCVCGHKVPVEGSRNVCAKCGRVYDSRGWIQNPARKHIRLNLTLSPKNKRVLARFLRRATGRRVKVQ